MVNWIKANIVLNNDLIAAYSDYATVGGKPCLGFPVSRFLFYIEGAHRGSARIERWLVRLYFIKRREWIDVDFEAQSQSIARQGKVVAFLSSDQIACHPKYYVILRSRGACGWFAPHVELSANANVDWGGKYLGGI